jgi:hypothetical protein
MVDTFALPKLATIFLDRRSMAGPFALVTGWLQ